MMDHGFKPYRVKIFFKYGGSVVLDGVTEYTSGVKDGSLNEIVIRQQCLAWQTWIDPNTLDLGSIAAIVRLPSERPPGDLRPIGTAPAGEA